MNADFFVVSGLVTVIFHLTKSKAFNKIYMNSEIILKAWRAPQYIIKNLHRHYNRTNVFSYQEYSNHYGSVLTIPSHHAFQTTSCSGYLFWFFEIFQPSYFCFSGCHLNYIFNICFHKFNTCGGKCDSASPDIMFKRVLNISFKIIPKHIPANRSANYAKVVDAIFKDLQFCSFIIYHTAWKASVFGVFLVRIVPHLDWIRTRKTPNTDSFNAVTFSR